MNGGVGLPSTKRAEGTGVVISFHDMNGRSYKRINGAGKGKTCRGVGSMLFLLLFAEKSEGHGYQFGCPRTGKPRRYDAVVLYSDLMVVYMT